MVDVEDPWQQDVSVTELTDTDIQVARNQQTRVADSGYELHRLVETLRQAEDLPDWGMTCDRALRVELAAGIDAYDIQFSREDYDIAYTIPPVGWIADREWETVDLVDEDDVDVSDRTIGFSTPPVVHTMAKDALDEGAYNTLTEMVETGVMRMLGRLDD